jgi:hypothetical protein
MSGDNFSLFTTVHKINEHERYCIGNMSLLRLMVKRWKFCPAEDSARVDEIAAYIKKHNNVVPGLINVAVIEGEGLVCWDGNHRFRAASRLETSPTLLFHVWESPSEDELKERYRAANSSINHTGTEKVSMYSCELIARARPVVDALAAKYKGFFTPRHAARQPHTNREAMTDFVCQFFTEHSTVDGPGLLSLLDRANDIMAQAVESSGLGEKALKKCQEGNCYLFIKGTSLRDVLNELCSQ